MNNRTFKWLRKKIDLETSNFLKYLYYGREGCDYMYFYGLEGHIKKETIIQRKLSGYSSKKIIIPSTRLLNLQKALREEVIKPFIKKSGIIFKYAHGGVKEKNILTYTQPHLGNKFFFVTDIQKAFPSVKIDYLQKCFENIGFYPDVAQVLIELNTYENHLPIGFASSPLLFNLLLNYFDNCIIFLLKEEDIAYTRYYDDIVFSSSSPISNFIQQKIIKTLNVFGFNAHPEKTIYSDVIKKSISVTGLVITKDKIKLSKKRINNFEGNLWLAIKDPLKWQPIIQGKLQMFRLVYGLDLPKKVERLFEEFEFAYTNAWRKLKGLSEI